MSFPRLRFSVLVTSSCAALAFACGGIADPTLNGGNGGTVATVSGALTGTSVPANARVALVWRTAISTPESGGYAVGDDVAVVGGKFSMSLTVPPAGYFSDVDSSSSKFSGSSSGSVNEPPTASVPAPAPGGGASSSGGKAPFASTLTPRDVASGGITSPLAGAVAGFVVYVDTNGNGKLDLSGAYASSTDQILGGNRDLVLTYLKDGGALDYEKLRDTSGILPAEGFNLAWTQRQRWLPLTVVELKLDGGQGLPYPVCSSSGYSAGSSSGSGGGTGGFNPVEKPAVPLPDPAPPGMPDAPPPLDGGAGGGQDGGPAPSYPSPSDPNLHCAPDGHSFEYLVQDNCPPPPPAPTGLCAGNSDSIGVACAPSGGYGASLPGDGSIPSGWPCPVSGAIDGGPAPDGGK